jgi:hypothetical protein
MQFAPLLKRASRHRELLDSLGFLNQMFGRHWHLISISDEPRRVIARDCSLLESDVPMGTLLALMVSAPHEADNKRVAFVRRVNSNHRRTEV